MAKETYDPEDIVRCVNEYLAQNPAGTLEELARRLALHPRTIRRALQSGGQTFRDMKRTRRTPPTNHRRKRARRAGGG
jgi:AraC-like DNA-binding protein